MHSHQNLPTLFLYLWNQKLCPRNSFGDHLFRLVLFHQSFKGHPMWPPMIALSDLEIYHFADPPFLHLMVIIQICDSASYCFFDDEKSRK